MNNKNNESATSVCGNKNKKIIEIEIIKLLAITIMIIIVIMIINNSNYENDAKLEIEKCNTACVGKTKIKKLKC